MGTAIAGIIFALIRSYLEEDRELAAILAVGYQMSLLDRKELWRRRSGLSGSATLSSLIRKCEDLGRSRASLMA